METAAYSTSPLGVPEFQFYLAVLPELKTMLGMFGAKPTIIPPLGQ